MADESAEANMIRDEVRGAVRRVETAVETLVGALQHAEDFTRGKRRHVGLTTMATPGRAPVMEEPARQTGAVQVRE